MLLFQLQFNLIFSEIFSPQFQRPLNQANAPLLLKSFPKRPRKQSEAQNKTKQTNKLAS
jgi:hypothetical protein